MQLPGDTDRVSIVGATGTGKTHGALWQLSLRNYNVKPWIVFDFKGDDLINSVHGAQHLSLESDIPKNAGVYIVHPNLDEEVEVENFLWRIWEHENVGIYIDEGSMIARGNLAYRACLTQGRSKHIPMIVLCQRPVWVDPYTFSESNYFQVFRIQYRKDIAKIEEYIPYDLEKRLPEHYSYYYDVARNEMVVLKPVPDRRAILDTFDVKLRGLQKAV